MRIDMTGRVCANLTVVKKAGVYRGYDTTWFCKCKCGNYTSVRGSFLRNGHTKSCGKCRKYALEDNHIRCTVKSGRSFIFDIRDFFKVDAYSWSVSKYGYVLGSNKKGTRTKLHRMLLKNPANVVDHINNTPWDCRRQNLREATQQQNTQNSRLNKNSTTGYKGVCFDKRKQKFLASIHPNRKTVFLGYYNNPIKAAQAYDCAALEYFGEFANLNFKGGENDKTE
jgi:hypothetical protein